jgi:RNA polymerase sigma-70 factor (ECF subfamily)
MPPDTEQIWKEVHRSLGTFIGKRVANEAEADDILQEVLLRMHAKLNSLRDPEKVTSWLYQIARNAVVDYYRSPERRKEIPAGLAADVEIGVPAVATSDDTSGRLRTELADCLRPMLDRLSRDYREAVALVELEGLTQQAAATRMGLSLSGMKSRVQRGRRQLKRMLDECCAIELDRRGGVADYAVRDGSCDPCKPYNR